jgi:hypothetical protein
MGKTLFAVSTAALMVAFIAGWAVARAETVQLSPFVVHQHSNDVAETAAGGISIKSDSHYGWGPVRVTDW